MNNSYIKTFTIGDFLKTLSMQQINELMVKLRVQKAYEIDNYLKPGEVVDFSHFVELNSQLSIEKNIYVEIQCVYSFGRFSGLIWQQVKKVRVFACEIDFKLYMALVDFQYPPKPDMVYFN